MVVLKTEIRPNHELRDVKEYVVFKSDFGIEMDK